MAATPRASWQVRTPLPGHFNVENALAALGAAHALGLDLSAAAEALASADRVPGRFEPIDEGQPFTVLVDYAHTPDSMENVLQCRAAAHRGPPDLRLRRGRRPGPRKAAR